MKIEELVKVLQSSDFYHVSKGRYGVDILKDQVTRKKIPDPEQLDKVQAVRLFIQDFISTAFRLDLLESPESDEGNKIVKESGIFG